MAGQDKLSEQQIAELLKKVGPLKEPPADMAARVKASVRAAWVEKTQVEKTQAEKTQAEKAWTEKNRVEETATKQSKWTYSAAAAVAVLSIGLVFTLQPRPVEIKTVAKVDAGRRAIEVLSDNQQWARTSNEGLSEGSVIRVNGNTPVSFTFNDGMNVRAQPGTRLQLASSHEITLNNGSIYLDSYNTQQPEPFTVTTTFGTARDIGTQFMVSLNDADSWSVQVRDGQVNVADDDQSMSLRPGDAITISAENDVSESSVSAHDASWQWSETARPTYNIEGRYLNDYLLWVSRETGRALRFRSESAKQSAASTRVHGTIDGLSARESLHPVLDTTNLRLVDGPENVIMVGITH
ncbi:MAG: FecR domain-containing protein [Candidatus Azotimanducaceae bacterium WSBS_2022_MAG_OTU7]